LRKSIVAIAVASLAVALVTDAISVAVGCEPRYIPNIGYVVEFLPFALVQNALPFFLLFVLTIFVAKKAAPRLYALLSQTWAIVAVYAIVQAVMIVAVLRS